MNLVDANIILRYLLDDVPGQSAQAAAIIEQKTVFVPHEVLAEVVYVLQKVYHVDREAICSILLRLLGKSSVRLQDAAAAAIALRLHATETVDFVDALLAEYATKPGVTLWTFDKKLRKLAGTAGRSI